MRPAAIVLASALSVGTAGCAAVAAALPGVLAVVQDGEQILSAIEGFVALVFAQHPDAELQAKVAQAVARARSALNLALRAAQGAKALGDQAVDAAFKEFEQAYLDLISLTRPLGVRPAGQARMAAAAGGGGLDVPEPMAFRKGAAR